MEFAFDFLFASMLFIYRISTHLFFFPFTLTRFVGDQEAWHELAELYINEHE